MVKLMFENLISSLQFEGEDKAYESKRRFERREQDRCVGVIGGRTYPIENWSQGGALIYADPRTFELGAETEVTLKFKLRDEILIIPSPARVVRKSYDHVAFEFVGLGEKLKRVFQTVIDDLLVSQLADSQLV